MNDFELDPRLANDCIVLGELDLCLLLLMNNALATWFILVPRTGETEPFLLPEPQRRSLQEETDLIARFVHQHFSPDKINLAAIGNIVRQMHIHVVGRKIDDYCWPNVVWGNGQREAYPDQEIQRIGRLLEAELGERFTRLG
jgi:diadenosine tetraphosphate (Ap4A) HIT family hydrolase